MKQENFSDLNKTWSSLLLLIFSLYTGKETSLSKHWSLPHSTSNRNLTAASRAAGDPNTGTDLSADSRLTCYINQTLFKSLPCMQHIVHFTFISSLHSKVVLIKQTILPKWKSTTSEKAAFETKRSLFFPSSAELWADIDSQFLLRVDLLSGKFYLAVVTSTLVLKAVCLSLWFPCQQSKVFKQKALELPFPRHSNMN